MPSILACPGSYLSFKPDMVMVDFFTAYHGGQSALIYERVVRLLLAGKDKRPPPVVTFVNFFEFADRHHATSTYTSMASQLTTSLRTLRSKEQTSALLDLGVRTDKSTAYDVADLWRGPTPKHVSEMAKLIRSWAASGQRDVQSTDVWRNWWRDMEVRALETAYRLPSVWVFRLLALSLRATNTGYTCAISPAMTACIRIMMGALSRWSPIYCGAA